MLALLVSGYFAVLQPDPAPRPDPETGVIATRWIDARAGDISALRDRLPDARVAALDERADALRVSVSCQELRDFITMLSCAPGPSLSAADIAVLGRVTGLGAHRVQLGVPVRVASSALVLGHSPASALERQVRTAALTLLPAPTVFSTASFVQRESSLTRWMEVGLILAFALIASATVVALVDRLLAARSTHLRLTLWLSPESDKLERSGQLGHPL